MPTRLIKSFGNRINRRIIRSYVDIKAPLYMLKRPPKHDVFKVLGVGNKAHAVAISIRGSIQAQPAK